MSESSYEDSISIEALVINTPPEFALILVIALKNKIEKHDK